MKRVILALIALAVIGMVTPVSAQTISYADAIDRLGRSCGKDIDRLCKGVNLGKIQACLTSKGGQVSGGCRTDMVEVNALLNRRFAAQEAVVGLCDRDIQQLCKMVNRGKGHVLRCILKAERRVSDKCNQAITDAGYR